MKQQDLLLSQQRSGRSSSGGAFCHTNKHQLAEPGLLEDLAKLQSPSSGDFFPCPQIYISILGELL